ncbi:MAG: hypothetical protein EHM12_12700 [Dehalococcoidia bacterium]|nr:MAG: hypothetical protein EHM12_12700 [Dehalococcoidia bacterium]
MKNSFYDDLNRRTRRFNYLDLKMAQFQGVCVALMAASLFPVISRLSVWWFAGALVLFAIRPGYVFFRRENRT